MFSPPKNGLSPLEFSLLIMCVLVLLLLPQCTSVATSTPPPVKYELTLTGLVDTVPFQGIAVGGSGTSHQMTIKSAINVDYFTVQSCHRSMQFSNVIQYPWFSWGDDNRSFTWDYDQAQSIEDSGDCLLRFCAFSKVVGSPPVACAIVDFHNNRYQLPSQNICNGTNGSAHGTSICHTQVGLIERMKFQGGVVTAKPVTDPAGKNAPYWIKDQCVGKFLDVDQTLFEYQAPENECSIVFMEKAVPHRRAKLTVVPYDSALYPGGN